MRVIRDANTTFVRSGDPPAFPITELSTCDKTAMAIATCRALFYPHSPTFSGFNDDTMAKAIEHLATDCPMFAGRVKKSTPLHKLSISSIVIDNSNVGIEFKVVDRTSTTIAAMMDPSSWTMKSIKINTPRFPPYLPSLDSGSKLLNGLEPVCKVRLTHLADGDVLAVSMSHMLTDGMHWPQFMTHLAARYKEQETNGTWKAPKEKLMAWDGNKQIVNYVELKRRYVEKGWVGADWEPTTVKIKAGFVDHMRAWALLLKNGLQKVDFNIVGVGNARLKTLKELVMGRVREGVEMGIFREGSYVATSDVVQALSMMMVKGAQRQSVLPMAPKSNLVLGQVPGLALEGEEKYFGNSVHLIQVNFDKGEVCEKELACVDVLTRLAVRIRERTLAYRGSPGKALQELWLTEEVSKVPLLKALGFLAGKRFPLVNCTTNYIGLLKEDAELEFGNDGVLLHEAVQWLVTPLARDMVVVRPHVPDDGLLFMMALTPKDSRRLRGLAWLDELLPDVTFY